MINDKEDERNILRDEKPFEHKKTRDGEVFIYWKGKMIKMISRIKGTKVLLGIENKSDYEIQLCLAKITGHFKHGNE